VPAVPLPLGPDGYPTAGGVTRRPVGTAESVRANRGWWDAAAPAYLAEHGRDLGDVDFLWCPEGLRESEAHLLGDVTGRRVLELGCGSAPCSRWLRQAGADAVGLDVSGGMLAHAAEVGRRTGVPVPLVQADVTALPVASSSFDAVCSAFGGLPFVPDVGAALREVARVLRPGGRWVFAVSHPFRWCLPDDGGEGGLRIRDSYFDRRPYVEQDDNGVATYVEHHRTLGDRVRELTAAGLVLLDLVEPEYPEDMDDRWGGGWSKLRGRLVPGTAIFVTEKR
jgi:SAM-dependent methyltransferase